MGTTNRLFSSIDMPFLGCVLCTGAHYARKKTVPLYFNLQMMFLFYHHKGFLDTGRPTDEIPTSRLEKGFLFHPIKNHTRLYHFHFRVLSSQLVHLREKHDRLRMQIIAMKKELGATLSSSGEYSGGRVLSSDGITRREDTYPLFYSYDLHNSVASVLSASENYTRTLNPKFIEQIEDSLFQSTYLWQKAKYGDKFLMKGHFNSIVFLYGSVNLHNDGHRGFVSASFRGRIKRSVHGNRTYALVLSQKYITPLLREEQSSDRMDVQSRNVAIQFIVEPGNVLAGPVHNFISEFKVLRDQCRNTKLFLSLVLILSQENSMFLNSSSIKVLQVSKLNDSSHLFQAYHNFKQISIFTNVFTNFSMSALFRVITSTSAGKQFYSPVVYQPVDLHILCPTNTSCPYNTGLGQINDAGVWREVDFTHLTVYNSDIINSKCQILRGRHELTECLLAHGLSPFRARDPGILHLPPTVMCAGFGELSQRKACYKEEAGNVGLTKHILKYIKSLSLG